LQLLAHYYAFIDSSWRVTGGTRQAFEAARDKILAALPEKTVAGLRATTNLELRQLAALPDAASDRAVAAPAYAARPNIPDNPYLKCVDEAVADPEVRAAVRRVQPACVRIGGGSGVNLTPAGLVLTNAHVADQIGSVLTAHFPDGRSLKAVCIALDRKLDLALCRLDSTEALPYAPVAAEAPPEGTRIVCIGNPGPNTPSGEPTGYKPFHVSTGKIRGYNGDPLGSQSMGRLMHDAWTYWGHSGSPLFDDTGRIVGLHNSWDSKTAMRHGVPLQAIRRFLQQEKVSEVENP
jgi:S1-C subfamily serine protease